MKLNKLILFFMGSKIHESCMTSKTSILGTVQDAIRSLASEDIFSEMQYTFHMRRSTIASPLSKMFVCVCARGRTGPLNMVSVSPCWRCNPFNDGCDFEPTPSV